MRTRFVVLPLAAALALLIGATGCDEIDARRTIQQANGEYDNARYEKARDLYEEALAKSPDLEIGHHNLGVTYYRLMKRHDRSEENQAIALKATEHLKVYLDKHPSDEKVRNLMTEIWRETGLFDQGIAFWQERVKANPEDAEALGILADFHYAKGEWENAVADLEQKVAISKDANTKASAYLQVGQLIWSLLFEGKDKFQGEQRVAMADRGIAALQKGLAQEPGLQIKIEITQMLATTNQQRALAASSRLAYQIDLAAYQNYMRSWSVLREEAKKQADAAAASPEGDDSQTEPANP